jgi:hypothetical protein
MHIYIYIYILCDLAFLLHLKLLKFRIIADADAQGPYCPSS